MNVDQQIDAWLQAHDYGMLVSKSSLSGGCINQSYEITSAKGQKFFLKTHSNPLPNMFFAEANGLEALANTQTIDIPSVYLVDEHYLLMEYYQPSRKASDYWPLLGEQLAKLHSNSQDTFGFAEDNYIGLNPQKNTQTRCGFTFFKEQRLLFQGRLARDKGLIDKRIYSKLELLCDKLDTLIPIQEPGLLHGDLWSGNLITNADGLPTLIDPAVHYGWPEAELAMTSLFGGFPAEFYDAYLAHSPMARDWSSRAKIYNLYHLLNHLNLFGTSYLSQVKSILSFYT